MRCNRAKSYRHGSSTAAAAADHWKESHKKVEKKEFASDVRVELSQRLSGGARQPLMELLAISVPAPSPPSSSSRPRPSSQSVSAKLSPTLSTLGRRFNETDLEMGADDEPRMRVMMIKFFV